MRFGLHLGTRGPAATPEGLMALALKAEAVGFHHLGLSDHVVIARQVDSFYPYTKTGKWFAHDTGVCLEQVTTLAFLAAQTTRIRLLSSVMVLPHRPPILAAKMLATADILSKGRLTVGVGVGWMAEELALLGAPAFKERGAASQEYIRAFRALWTEAAPVMAGRHARFAGLYFEPKPVQRPIPIWVGGEGPQARRRAGRMGDGWYPVGNNPAAPFDTRALYAAGLADVRQAAEQAGRDPASLETGLLALWFRQGEGATGRDGKRLCFTGAAADILEDIETFAQAGLKHLVISFESDDLNRSLDRIEAFASEVMSRTA